MSSIAVYISFGVFLDREMDSRRLTLSSRKEDEGQEDRRDEFDIDLVL
jgi:hypothetical protein